MSASLLLSLYKPPVKIYIHGVNFTSMLKKALQDDFKFSEQD